MENRISPPYGCVLLVDDDPITNFVNQKILLQNAFADHVHVLNNGEDALVYIEEECDDKEKKPKCPELIFLDINMPVMDGFEFLEQIQYSEHESKVIILTSSDNPKDLDRMGSFSIRGYVSKPLNKEKLARFL